ncbi:Nucleolar Complex 2 protein [Coniosporium apollinis]|uniref:Nucleolar Complex 2 protein n=2 Tax=Coniosporium TaxID=2810619 RepID=A0ABQ9P4Z1_9PEZI|nr:Nucleolar Complex 2 protein [Cladosporium sp. JES 115]KAJ9668376.1 Nucleolar Complex 2 protein [Coniosporium apollinis]
MPQTKATRKFEKNRLPDLLKKRKEVAKIKQKQQIKAKRKERKAKDNERADDVEDAKPQQRKKEAGGNPFGDMSVDEFFQGGFDIPEDPKKKGGQGAKHKEIPAKTGKRKRTEGEEDEEAVSSPAGFGEEEPVASDAETDSENDLGAHKQELDALAKKDPEFFKYLQENDRELLDFEKDADLAGIDALSDSEDEGAPKKKQKKDKKRDGEMEDEAGNEVTKAMVKKWRTAMTEQHSLRATREVVLAFRAAAHLNEEDDKQYKYSISNPDVYHDLLIAALTHIPEILQHHLPVKETAAGKIRLPSDTKKYRTLTPLLKSHTASLHHLLENLSDTSTLKLTLSSLLPLLPYILSFKKALRDLARTAVSIWSAPSSTDATRISAFLVLRRLMVIGDPSIREAVLKAVYTGLVKSSRATTVHTLAGLNLMKNSAAELWGLDASVGYTTAFGFIRQAAIHLRNSITNKTKDSYKNVYNWQYVHSLDFWSRVLSVHCDALKEAERGRESELRPLVYPVTQVTLGAIRLIPTAQYFPLRFLLVRSLLRLSRATGVYIPLAPALLEVLSSAEMKKSPKPSTLKALDFTTSIRAGASYLRTRVYQDGVGEQVAELLAEFFVLWAKNIAFPELALPVVVMLKRWLKEVNNKATGNKNGKVNGMVALVVQKLEANSRWIEERRAKVEFAPNDRAGVEGFLKEVEWQKTPLGAFVAGQRTVREEKAKVLEEARREEERKRKEEREEEQRERMDEVDGVESEESDQDMEDVSDEDDE